MNKRRFRVYTVSADILILALSFIVMTWLKPAGMKTYVPSHAPFFLVLALFWVIVSLLSGKIGSGQIVNLKTLLYHVITSNIVATSIAAMLMFAFRDLGFSRTVVFGTALTATFLELVAGTLWISFGKAAIQVSDQVLPSEREMVARTHPLNGNGYDPDPYLVAKLAQGVSEERASALAAMVSPAQSSRLSVVSTAAVFNIQNLAAGDYSCIINLRPMNAIRGLDAFLDEVNVRLTGDGIYICCVETMQQRSRRLRKRLTPVLYYPVLPVDFLLKRVIPRLRITRGLWQYFTRGANPPLSRAEALGRLCRAGFAIRQEKFEGNMLLIKAERRSEPLPVNGSGYGMIIGLPRIGYEGRTFTVFKLRTMHPYSEFIQDYVYDLHDLQDGGKMKQDFRVTNWGRVCRRIWLDELPMIVNLFAGDMKLVGVRPLSPHYFNLYSEDMKQRRINYKPGLLPPFYADMPSDLDRIQQSELKYLDAWDRSHTLTDIRYFFKGLWNIVFQRVRSN